MASEQLGGTDFDLQTGVELNDFRAVVAFRAFERVAARVVVKGLRVLLSILERLTQREAQMIPINNRRRGGRLRGIHLGQLCILEPIGLQVREAPVDVAISGSR